MNIYQKYKDELDKLYIELDLMGYCINASYNSRKSNVGRVRRYYVYKKEQYDLIIRRNRPNLAIQIYDVYFFETCHGAYASEYFVEDDESLKITNVVNKYLN